MSAARRHHPNPGRQPEARGREGAGDTTGSPHPSRQGTAHTPPPVARAQPVSAARRHHPNPGRQPEARGREGAGENTGSPHPSRQGTARTPTPVARAQPVSEARRHPTPAADDYLLLNRLVGLEPLMPPVVGAIQVATDLDEHPIPPLSDRLGFEVGLLEDARDGIP